MSSVVDRFDGTRPVRRPAGLRVGRARPPRLGAAPGISVFQRGRAAAMKGVQ
jgi:hypothetical protein